MIRFFLLKGFVPPTAALPPLPLRVPDAARGHSQPGRAAGAGGGGGGEKSGWVGGLGGQPRRAQPGTHDPMASPLPERWAPEQPFCPGWLVPQQ